MKFKILINVMLQLSFINAIAQRNAIKRSSAKNRIYAVKDNLPGNFRQTKSFILNLNSATL